mgnify:FL=1
MTNRVFVDLDGVVVDFDRYMRETGLTSGEVKTMPGAYLSMPPIPGAIEAVRSLIGMGYEVWIATKPPTGIPYAYADKAAWVMENLPELSRRIIITHDKGLLGDARDILIDDRPHKANCTSFKGRLLHFNNPNIEEVRHRLTWPEVLELLGPLSPNERRRKPVEPKVGDHITVTNAGADGTETFGDYIDGDTAVIREIGTFAHGRVWYDVSWTSNLVGKNEGTRNVTLFRDEFEVTP